MEWAPKNGVAVSSSSKMGNQDVWLSPIGYTSIYLDANGGSVGIDKLDYSILFGTAPYMSDLPEPIRNGYKFIGWYATKEKLAEKGFYFTDDQLVTTSTRLTCWKKYQTTTHHAYLCGITLVAKWEDQP